MSLKHKKSVNEMNDKNAKNKKCKSCVDEFADLGKCVTIGDYGGYIDYHVKLDLKKSDLVYEYYDGDGYDVDRIEYYMNENIKNKKYIIVIKSHL